MNFEKEKGDPNKVKLKPKKRIYKLKALDKA